MSREKPPDSPSRVVRMEDYKREKAERERKEVEAQIPRIPRDLEGEKFNRRKYFEHEINRIGKEKWTELMRFARRTEVIHPNKHDKILAEQFLEMTDKALLFQFKITNIEFWEKQPLAFKTLYEEIGRRMRGEK